MARRKTYIGQTHGADQPNAGPAANGKRRLHRRPGRTRPGGHHCSTGTFNPAIGDRRASSGTASEASACKSPYQPARLVIKDTGFEGE
jgi:hypothetical protein